MRSACMRLRLGLTVDVTISWCSKGFGTWTGWSNNAHHVDIFDTQHLARHIHRAKSHVERPKDRKSEISRAKAATNGNNIVLRPYYQRFIRKDFLMALTADTCSWSALRCPHYLVACFELRKRLPGHAYGSVRLISGPPDGPSIPSEATLFGAPAAS